MVLSYTIVFLCFSVEYLLHSPHHLLIVLSIDATTRAPKASKAPKAAKAPKATSGSGKGKGKGGSKGTNLDDREHAGGGGGYTREDHHRSPPHENDHDSDDYPWNSKKNGECGRQGHGAPCPHDKPCCGKDGMCGLSEDACGHGCQPNFGACLASRSPPTKGNTGNANSLQAGDANSQATTISPVTAAIVGASAFVAGILFAILLFAASKKREEKASERKKRRKNVVAVAAEEDDGIDNNDDDYNSSMGEISSIHSTPTFGNYPDGGDDDENDGDYVISPNPTMVDTEENNDNQLSLDDGGWQAAIQKSSGRTDAFGHNANLMALEKQLYNAESRKMSKNHISSIREEMYSEDVPFDETLYGTPPTPPPPIDPPASKRDRYFDFHDDDDFLGTY